MTIGNVSGAQIDKGSFRDPAGRVCQIDDRILRLLSPEGLTQFRQIRDKAFWKKALESSLIVNTREIPLEDYKDKIRNIPFETAAILEHEKVPFVSYPFEWPFRLLKRAALLHLDLQLAALKDDINVSDGTAFNVQFVGSKPVFIDVLSFRPYSNGDYWDGYSQFCSSFLGPMLLSTYRNIPFGHIYRGNLTGIPVEVISQLLPLRSRLKFATLVHIHLQAHLARRVKASGTPSAIAAQKSKPLPKKSLVGLITSLRRVVEKLTEKGVAETVWSDYESNNSYTDEESQLKLKLVTDYANTYNPS
ncbi:MAG: hypothetical protein MI923_22875, partial [Phycisphaerales bacterium]|nr:hypothetical protein [Phycisphaerales bacterium]